MEKRKYLDLPTFKPGAFQSVSSYNNAHGLLAKGSAVRSVDDTDMNKEHWRYGT
jgi:hypothetical protein